MPSLFFDSPIDYRDEPKIQLTVSLTGERWETGRERSILVTQVQIALETSSMRCTCVSHDTMATISTSLITINHISFSHIDTPIRSNHRCARTLCRSPCMGACAQACAVSQLQNEIVIASQLTWETWGPTAQPRHQPCHRRGRLPSRRKDQGPWRLRMCGASRDD